MKNFYSSTLLTLITLLIYTQLSVAQIQTPQPSPHASSTQTVGLTEIELDFSRPGIKDRLIFGPESKGALVPYGKIWRTGANAATTISFSDDVKFGGKDVEAGKYALYTIPNDGEWTVMLYEDLSLGGNVANYDESKEYARFSSKSKNVDHSHESFFMYVDDITSTSANLYIVWDKTKAWVPIEVTYDDKVTAQIEAQLENPMASVANLYFSASSYYFNEGKDLNQALEWMNKGLEINDRAFWHMHTKAKILAQLGKKEEAIEVAKISKEKASKWAGGDFGYIKRNDDLIAELK
ncbi:MAG: DUF2911 domain-containing protein [Bacteroidota bacterium]